jgi:hypothetical protein
MLAAMELTNGQGIKMMPAKTTRALRRIFFRPIAMFDELLNFASLVTVLLSLHRAIIGLAECVFGVANDFAECLDRFAHFLLVPGSDWLRSGKSAEEDWGWQGLEWLPLASKAPKLMVEV